MLLLNSTRVLDLSTSRKTTSKKSARVFPSLGSLLVVAEENGERRKNCLHTGNLADNKVRSIWYHFPNSIKTNLVRVVPNKQLYEYVAKLSSSL